MHDIGRAGPTKACRQHDVGLAQASFCGDDFEHHELAGHETPTTDMLVEQGVGAMASTMQEVKQGIASTRFGHSSLPSTS